MILPFAKALYLCDGHIGYPGGKTDLMGLFNSIRALSYPHLQKQFVVFAQLIGGLGDVPFHIEVRLAAAEEPFHSTIPRTLHFLRRTQLLQLAYTINDCPFDHAGTYLVELYCEGQWVADTTLELIQAGEIE